MDLKQKLELLEKAIELGADVHISFHRVGNKTLSEKLAGEFSEAIDAPFTYHNHGTTNWLDISPIGEGFDVSFFFEEEEATA